MANFLIYQGKHEEQDGRVDQSNKVFEPYGYSDRLNEMGLKWIAIDNEGYLPPDKIRIVNNEIVKRPEMPIQISKTTIKAGGKESAIFRNVPVNAKVIISVAGLGVIEQVQVPSTSFDLPIPVPCTYNVKIELWPWIPYEVNIEAVA